MKTNSNTCAAAFFVAVIIVVLIMHLAESSESLHPESRIINGLQVTNQEKFSCVAKIYIDDKEGVGIKISNSLIVTTATFLNLFAVGRPYKVVLNSLRNPPPNFYKDAIEVKISRVEIHEQFKMINSKPNQYNIGLLVFTEQITSVKNVMINYKNHETFKGQELILTGWGRTSLNGDLFETSRNLMYGAFHIEKRKKCNDENKQTMCIHSPAFSGSTNGDIGAPLFFRNEGGDVELVGLFIEYTKDRKYSKCISMKYFKNWIEEKIKKIVAPLPKPRDNTYAYLNEMNNKKPPVQDDSDIDEYGHQIHMDQGELDELLNPTNCGARRKANPYDI